VRTEDKLVKEIERGCGLEVALSVIGGKWKPIVLFHLSSGPCRYGELRRLVRGISEKVLIQQLRELSRDGIILRRDYQEVPPRVDYKMTEFGLSLAAALVPLCNWGSVNRARVRELLAAAAG
jgi:DNA-binding HxlR family transcriptional regulator